MMPGTRRAGGLRLILLPDQRRRPDPRQRHHNTAPVHRQQPEGGRPRGGNGVQSLEDIQGHPRLRLHGLRPPGGGAHMRQDPEGCLGGNGLLVDRFGADPLPSEVVNEPGDTHRPWERHPHDGSDPDPQR